MSHVQIGRDGEREWGMGERERKKIPDQQK